MIQAFQFNNLPVAIILWVIVYSLDYYFVPPLPACAQRSQPLWLHQLAGEMPVLGPPKATR